MQFQVKNILDFIVSSNFDRNSFVAVKDHIAKLRKLNAPSENFSVCFLKELLINLDPHLSTYLEANDQDIDIYGVIYTRFMSLLDPLSNFEISYLFTELSRVEHSCSFGIIKGYLIRRLMRDRYNFRCTPLVLSILESLSMNETVEIFVSFLRIGYTMNSIRLSENSSDYLKMCFISSVLEIVLCDYNPVINIADILSFFNILPGEFQQRSLLFFYLRGGSSSRCYQITIPLIESLSLEFRETIILSALEQNNFETLNFEATYPIVQSPCLLSIKFRERLFKIYFKIQLRKQIINFCDTIYQETFKSIEPFLLSLPVESRISKILYILKDKFVHGDVGTLVVFTPFIEMIANLPDEPKTKIILIIFNILFYDLQSATRFILKTIGNSSNESIKKIFLNIAEIELELIHRDPYRKSLPFLWLFDFLITKGRQELIKELMLNNHVQNLLQNIFREHSGYSFFGKILTCLNYSPPQYNYNLISLYCISELVNRGTLDPGVCCHVVERIISSVNISPKIQRDMMLLLLTIPELKNFLFQNQNIDFYISLTEKLIEENKTYVRSMIAAKISNANSKIHLMTRRIFVQNGEIVPFEKVIPQMDLPDFQTATRDTEEIAEKIETKEEQETSTNLIRQNYRQKYIFSLVFSSLSVIVSASGIILPETFNITKSICVAIKSSSSVTMIIFIFLFVFSCQQLCKQRKNRIKSSVL
ncbi:MAG: hypothetical protein LBJ93_02640 [Clostridiales bacterium]|jgi:hypothetical protein|nr:hypothetical protein [Clostridiales bacterium]